MFVGTVSVSRREMGLHLIDPVPPFPHGHRTMHSAIIWVLMLSFLVQNKPTISAPPPSCCRQTTCTHLQTKGKDNNGDRITFAGQRQVFKCWRDDTWTRYKVFSTTCKLLPENTISRFLCTTNQLQQAQIISFVIDLVCKTLAVTPEVMIYVLGSFLKKSIFLLSPRRTSNAAVHQ